MTTDPRERSIARLRKIDQIRDRFEAALRAGQSPRLEDHLTKIPVEDRSELLKALVGVELELTADSDATAEIRDYLARFPDYRAAVQAGFREAGLIDSVPEDEADGTAFPVTDAAETTTSIATPTEDVEQSIIPERIGRYRPIQLLGRGGFGHVFLAEDEELKRQVAVKLAMKSMDEDEAGNFLAEARMVATLDHPHIVPVYDVGHTDQGLVYVVSKFIAGSDLAGRLRDDRPPPNPSAKLIMTLAEALHYAHTQGLVHRDIKPGNILLDLRGQAYLCDFGLALRYADLGSGPRIAGTPAYMSPEQARGHGHFVDGRADIFSLGVVFYELLTGQRPFRADSAEQVLRQVSRLEARPPRQIDDSIPPALESICLKALANRLSDRYTTAADLARDLRAYLTDLSGMPTARKSQRTASSSNVPDLPTFLVPRQEELERSVALLLDPAGPRRLAIVGMGGIGKSVLAAAVVRDSRINDAFPDGTIWVTLGQDPSLVARQAQIAAALGEAPAEFVDLQQGRAKLSELTAEKSCILVLDDVWQATHLAAFDCLGPTSRLLMTTRNVGLATTIGASSIDVAAFDQAKSLSLLAEWSGDSAGGLPSEAREVVRKCGGLPLALAMIGATVRHKPHRWKSVVERLRESNPIPIGRQFPDYPYPDVMRAIQVSVDSLGEEARSRYEELAVFAKNVHFPTKAAARLWAFHGLGEFEAEDLLELFVDHCLLFRDSREAYHLHDLQVDFVQKSVEKTEDRLLHQRMLDSYRSLCNSGWSSGPDDHYFFHYLPYHLERADRLEELCTLLQDYAWLRAKLLATDVQALVQDFDRARLLLPYDANLQLLGHAMSLSAHRLAKDKGLLPSQLFGRLLDLDSSGIQQFLKRAEFAHDQPWLRPVTRCLIPSGGPLECTLEGHQNAVCAVAASADGRTLVSGSNDHTIRVWRLPGGFHKCIGHLHYQSGTGWTDATDDVEHPLAHMNRITSVAVASDGRFAVSGSCDHTVKMWDLNNGRLEATLRGHQAWVNDVVIAPGDRFAVSASSDGTFIRWDLEAARCDAKTGMLSRIPMPHERGIYSITCSGDGRYLVSGGRGIAVWEFASGQPVQVFAGCAARINALAMTPDNRLVISASEAGAVQVWEVDSGELKATMKLRETVRSDSDSPLPPPAVSVKDLLLLHRGRVLCACADGTLRILDLSSGHEHVQWQAHASAISAATLLGSGDRVVTAARDHNLRVWNLASVATASRSDTGHSRAVRAVAITDDGRYCLSASDDRTVKCWGLKDGSQKAVFPHSSGVSTLAVIPDSHRFVSAGSVSPLHVWNISTGRKTCSLTGIYEVVGTIDVSADGRYVASTHGINLEVWDLTTEPQTAANDDALPSLPRMATLRGHVSRIRVMALAPDGRCIVSGANDESVRLWDLPSGRQQLELKGPHHCTISSLVVTSDSQYVIGAFSNGQTNVWERDGGRLVSTCNHHQRAIHALAVTPDGKRVITSSSRGPILVWQLATTELQFTLRGHEIPAGLLQVSSNGRWLLSGSRDGLIKVWDLCSGELMASFACESEVRAVALSPDAQTIVAGDGLGSMYFLRLEYAHDHPSRSDQH